MVTPLFPFPLLPPPPPPPNRDDSYAPHMCPHPLSACACPPRPPTDGGSQIGHVLPGVVFILWATHWLLALLVSRARKEPHLAQSFRPLFVLPPMLQPTEAWLKATLPLLAISLELYFAHHGPTAYRCDCMLKCNDSTGSTGNDSTLTLTLTAGNGGQCSGYCSLFFVVVCVKLLNE